MNLIEVVAGVQILNSRFCIYKKKNSYWEFPGGKVHEGETHEMALHREWREELGLDIEKVGPNLGGITFRQYQIYFYEVLVTERPKIWKDHEALYWCYVQDILFKPYLGPADLQFMKDLCELQMNAESRLLR